MQHDTDPRSDRDLLLGVEAVTAYLNSLFDEATQVNKAVVYVWAAQDYIPVRRIGARMSTD